MKSPLISVIIPCHNAAPWLRSCLLSCLSQTHRPIEVILVNDRSTDGSEAIAREWEPEGLIYLESDAGNASAARNRGLEAARGDWIQFLDADDILASDKIERQVRLIQERPEVRLVSGEWARFHNHPREANFKPEPNWRDLTGIEFLQLHFREGWMMQPGAWLTRRDLIDKAGLWDESLSLNDDGEFFARVMLKAEQIHFCSRARVYYRSHQGITLSSRTSRDAMQSLFDSVELIFISIQQAADPETSRPIMADGWKWMALELAGHSPELSREAEKRCRELGGSTRNLPGGKLFHFLEPWMGWRMARAVDHSVHRLIPFRVFPSSA